MAPSNEKHIHKRSTGQNITISSTNQKLKPGELKNNKKSDFKKINIIEEVEYFLGEGIHGSVHCAKIPQEGGGIISYAVKIPPEYYNEEKRKSILHKWLRKINKMKSIGIENVVDYAEIIDDKLFLTDLRIYGEVLDFELDMDRKTVSNFDSIILGVSQDLGKIHDAGLILSDAFGAYGFRAWFLLKSKTREGFTGERVICDVGGVERFPSSYMNPDFENKKFIHEVKKKYKQTNLLSIMAIVSFDPQLCQQIYDNYINSIVKPKHLIYANEIFSEFKKDRVKVIDEFNELALDY